MSESTGRPRAASNREHGSTASSALALRLRADEIARAKTSGAGADIGAISTADAKQVIHELRVHQIELELQNEELRRALDALETARTRYFDLYDLAPVSYFTVGKEGLILEMNLAGARLFDVDRAAILNRPLTSFVLREDQDIYYHAFKQLDLLGSTQAVELRMTTRSGRPFWAWIEAAIATDEEGNAVRRMVITDISYRKAVEHELRMAETLREGWNYYRQLAESLPQLVWASELNGMWEYVSPQWLRYTGFPEEEQLEHGWLRQVHPDDRAAAMDAWKAAVMTGNTFEAEFRIRRSDGIYRRFKSRAVPIRDESGVVSKWFGTSTDVDDPPIGNQ